MTDTRSEGCHQTLVPEHEDIVELSSRSYHSFEEQKSIWAREIRQLATGQTLLRLVDDPKIYRVDVKRSAPGYLKYDLGKLVREFPEVMEAVDALIEQNFQSSIFASATEIDRESELRLQAVAYPRIEFHTKGSSDNVSEATEPPADADPFA